ncbi:NAD-glutamate dehydrogenase [Piscirickettsia salmonis]|nr:NAD-glutamate dehydrogenase [Piscirickettsia salmonis]
MTRLVTDNVTDIVENVVTLVNEKVAEKQAPIVAEFVRQLYNVVSYEDLASRDIVDLYGAAMSHWNFIYQRKAKEAKVRVYNPNFEQHGWQSTHTVIEVGYDDMPFLVDSLSMVLNRRGVTIHLVIHVGGMKFQRNDKHQITKVLPWTKNNRVKDVTTEAPIYIEIDRQIDDEVLESLKKELLQVLHDVSVSVEDWPKMREACSGMIEELNKNAKAIDADELKESMEFLRWVHNNHFTFLGCCDYELSGKPGEEVLRAIEGTGLGVLRDRSSADKRDISALPPEAREISLSVSPPLIVAKTSSRATVHRPAYTDFIGVKCYSDKGKLIGERRFIGLYTSTAYNSNPRTIPLLRLKVERILERAGFPAQGHAGKALLNILETFPRDDLLQAPDDELFEMASGILHLQERQRIRLFMRRDTYGRFYSCLVYLPRDRFNSRLRHKMQDILIEELNGHSSEFTTLFSESVLARVHIIIRVKPTDGALDINLKELEQKLIGAAREWSDDLHDVLVERFGESKGALLARKYSEAFPLAYQEDFMARTAVVDVEHVEDIIKGKEIAMSFYRRLEESSSRLRFKVFIQDEPVELSIVLPMLENMGLRVLGERPYELKMQKGATVWISDFTLEQDTAGELDVDRLRESFHEMFLQLWYGKVENDSFNRLVVNAGLSWREITSIRAYAKYLLQTGFKFSQPYMEDTFNEHPKIAKLIASAFEARFHPQKNNSDNFNKIEQKVLKLLDDEVTNLDKDTILRRFLDLMKATLRTNFYQKTNDSQMKDYVSYKFSPDLIPDLPLPRPAYEVFVYSPRVEGVHLRGAKVARGGLRWSDRREDFRTEILGLMKAQQVKNSVIVPQGAKGGFVPKNLPEGSRDEVLKEAIACYKIFISGLLDITDNLNSGDIVKPVDVVRYDEDDPYLVVAADKGTATFSDIANGVARDYGFWLDDAFASGGSVGYDHKKMGITARGAWESVKRHFREHLSIDCQTTDFTVVGIGDMAGDVFGNGMLLSRHIRLVGAFNHMHIFIDPTPDSATSYAERQRLFELSGSTWADYNSKLISKGGGVFKRSAKFIRLTPEIKELLGVDDDVMIPNDVIKALLKAKVDLVWNGGIGTYVKSTKENDGDVGDRANDSVRVNASDLNCKVVGEGGNLGLAQRARIEFGLKGGACYTGFIDNSAGVDCSDHEVNIKILLNEIVANGDMTEKQRNELLAQMTDEVGELCLHNNYRQTQAINVAVRQGIEALDLYVRQIRDLERQGHLNREIEFLPDDEALQERKAEQKGLTFAEFAVVLAYSKNVLKQELVASDVVDDPAFFKCLEAAFPQVLCKSYSKQMREHRLAREIVATQLANSMTNYMGVTFVSRLRDETGSQISEITRAYMVAARVFDVDGTWAAIEELDGQVDPKLQMEMMREVTRVIRRGTRWFLRNRRKNLDIVKASTQFYSEVEGLFTALPTLLDGEDAQYFNNKLASFIEEGVPEHLAMKMAGLRFMYSALDIVEAANIHNFTVEEVARVYFILNHRLSLGWFRFILGEHLVQNYWEALARAALRDDLDWQQRGLTIGVMSFEEGSDEINERLDGWIAEYEHMIDRWNSMVSDLRASNVRDFVMFFVAMRELIDISQSTSQSQLELEAEAGSN